MPVGTENSEGMIIGKTICCWEGTIRIQVAMPVQCRRNVFDPWLPAVPVGLETITFRYRALVFYVVGYSLFRPILLPLEKGHTKIHANRANLSNRWKVILSDLSALQSLAHGATKLRFGLADTNQKPFHKGNFCPKENLNNKVWHLSNFIVKVF